MVSLAIKPLVPLLLLFLSSLKPNAHSLDIGSSVLTISNVCFTSEDCHSDTGNQTTDGTTRRRPRFCLNAYECLCNRLQAHQHSLYELLTLSCTKCTEDHIESQGPKTDPCTVQDPYSVCNNTTGFCQCSEERIQALSSMTADEWRHQLIKKELPSGETLQYGSVCIRHLINQQLDWLRQTNQTPSEFGSHHESDQAPEHDETADLVLTCLLAYVVPFGVLFFFIYYSYTRFCRSRTAPDSEMILYKPL